MTQVLIVLLTIIVCWQENKDKIKSGNIGKRKKEEKVRSMWGTNAERIWQKKDTDTKADLLNLISFQN